MKIDIFQIYSKNYIWIIDNEIFYEITENNFTKVKYQSIKGCLQIFFADPNPVYDSNYPPQQGGYPQPQPQPPYPPGNQYPPGPPGAYPPVGGGYPGPITNQPGAGDGKCNNNKSLFDNYVIGNCYLRYFEI